MEKSKDGGFEKKSAGGGFTEKVGYGKDTSPVQLPEAVKTLPRNSKPTT